MRIFFILILFVSSLGFAQEEPQLEDNSLNEIEQEVGRSSTYKKPVEKEIVNKDVNNVTDLANLAPFSNVAVIQKRFLPKTQRFELNGNFTLITNNQFFNSMGASARFAYYFTEQWGLELNYLAMSTTERDVIKELKDDFNVNTENFSTPKSYTGLDIKYVPIYGKMSWFNEKIIPYDLYFSLGAGTTKTNTTSNASTIHIGTGEMFALSKSTAFRWDLSWNFYSAKNINGESQSFNNLFLSAGFSYLFPEAKYR